MNAWPGADSLPDGSLTLAGMHDLPRLLERLHRRFLDILRIELERLGNSHVTPVQGLMLLTIGEASLTVRELVERGYYLGSAAAGNLKALLSVGLVEMQAAGDRRSAHLRLTPAGTLLCRELRRVEAGHIDELGAGPQGEADLRAAYRLLHRLERAWADVIRPEAIDVI